MNFHIITLFPESFSSYLNESILARAIKNKKIKVSFYNPRDFVTGKYRKVWPDGGVMAQVDDRPYGGGPGMVLRAEPVLKAVAKAVGKRKAKVIILSPSGKQFNNTIAEKLKNQKDIVIICGRYEGIDARVKKILKATLSTKALASVEEYSVGPYVLTGGELPAMIMIDSISRRISGVLNKSESLEENRISTSEVYTRPEILVYKGKRYKVPKVLLSGHRAKIDKWKKR
ncbi:MAG: tRNA (guanosine(37)-N1)-methyltransferase TrmD [bacterium]|nr:tRNA (guanosine(37)-N1)-methyltransferase TrmD [bacterium]